ncbi:tRNA(Ile)-lysidine synthase [Skermanella aerolata]|uniref:tRNA lysidine(34) synthetase TilS n=1 Tax=Skermanella aerolata TaxID=393310 RepID=UPI003D1D6ED9
MIAEFTRLMDRLGPFEPSPRVAVGVSGGADSMALCLLLKSWTEDRNGSLLALTVDHGLRQNAADEAIQVGSWLKARDVAHDILRWDGVKPSSGIQSAARDARYRLLTERCHAEGILHLALAHHREDQAETVLLRFAHGSGIDGLGGMAAVRETGSVRLLRPLLPVSRDRLRTYLTETCQSWVEDPSNQSPAYARVRLRGMADILAGEGWSTARGADTARRLGWARSALDAAAARLAAQAVEVWPEGCVLLRQDLLCDAEEETALRLLSRCLAAVGGSRYRPKLEAVERLYCTVRDGSLGRGRTLGGCRILPYRDGRLLIAREPEAADEQAELGPGATILWDGRFTVKSLFSGAARVVRLGLHPVTMDPALRRLPAPVRQTLPTIVCVDGEVFLPRFEFASHFKHPEGDPRPDRAVALFRPQEPFAAFAFVVV